MRHTSFCVSLSQTLSKTHFFFNLLARSIAIAFFALFSFFRNDWKGRSSSPTKVWKKKGKGAADVLGEENTNAGGKVIKVEIRCSVRYVQACRSVAVGNGKCRECLDPNSIRRRCKCSLRPTSSNYICTEFQIPGLRKRVMGENGAHSAQFSGDEYWKCKPQARGTEGG